MMPNSWWMTVRRRRGFTARAEQELPRMRTSKFSRITPSDIVRDHVGYPPPECRKKDPDRAAYAAR